MFRLNLDKIINEGRRLEQLEKEDKETSPIKSTRPIRREDFKNDKDEAKNSFPR